MDVIKGKFTTIVPMIAIGPAAPLSGFCPVCEAIILMFSVLIDSVSVCLSMA